VHLPKVCCLDRVVGVKGIRDSVVTVVVSTICYFHFISYRLMLITPSTCSLSWLRLSSRVLSCIISHVLLLGPSSVGGVVGNVACSISDGIGSWVGSSVGGDVDWLRHFVLTTPLFSHTWKGSVVIVVETMTRSLHLLLE
jgi:hypothetical protein